MTSDPDAAISELFAAVKQLEGGRWQASHDGALLDSHFQPIYSFPHRRSVGHEALLRVVDAQGLVVPPLHFFERLSGFDEQVKVDRLSRLLHVHNFVNQQDRDGWLFLNIHPAVFVHGARQPDMLEAAVKVVQALGVPPHRLVFEVTEDVMAQDAEFESAVANARATGCLLALDDFGAGHSNFDRVWRIHPEIVKLDRSLLRRAVASPRVSRVLTQMVSLLHECGALVLLEGVETRDEALLALDADVDLVQGFAFGVPAPDLVGSTGTSGAIENVWKVLDERHVQDRLAHTQHIAPFTAALKKALPGLRQGQPLHQAAASLLALPGVQLCYLLDEHGVDCVIPVEPEQQGLALTGRPASDKRFEPLEQAGSARWARRPYFRRAVSELGQVQVTRPYLSLHGARMCVTVSLAFWSNARMLVICADLDWVNGGE